MGKGKKFSILPRLFIVGVTLEPDPENCIKTIRMSEYDGAVAFDLYLPSFPALQRGRMGEDARTKFSIRIE